HLALREGGSESQPLATGEEPVEVVLETEESPLPHADDVVCEVGPDESGVQDRDARLGDRDVLALDPRATRLENRAHDRTILAHCTRSCRVAHVDNPSVAALATPAWDALAEKALAGDHLIPDEALAILRVGDY